MHYELLALFLLGLNEVVVFILDPLFPFLPSNNIWFFVVLALVVDADSFLAHRFDPSTVIFYLSNSKRIL